MGASAADNKPTVSEPDTVLIVTWKSLSTRQLLEETEKVADDLPRVALRIDEASDAAANLRGWSRWLSN